MRTKACYLGLLTLVALSACDRRAELASSTGNAAPVALKSFAPRQSEEVERKLIKEGSLEFETKSIESARKTIEQAVSQYHGYISSDQQSNYPGRNTSTLVVRIPTVDFDNFLKASTAGVDKFDQKDIQLKDVTEEFLDVHARLKTKKELESRYHEILKETKSVAEILEVEKEIGKLRADIESFEGRIKYLENQISFSVITITFYQSVHTPSAFGQKIKDGFGNGWNNLTEFFVAIVNIWPFVVLGTIAYFLFNRFRRSKKLNTSPPKV
ncbi:MAG: DUF4349 domain-containing protein [Chryseolinea sp.]